jgi:hypothetical protein
VPVPVVFGRPRLFFGITRIDFPMNYGYHKIEPRGSSDFQFEDDPEGPTGKAVRYTARKNKVSVVLVGHAGAAGLHGRLEGPAGRWVDVRDDGSEWPSEKEMQTHVSHWLATRSARN